MKARFVAALAAAGSLVVLASPVAAGPVPPPPPPPPNCGYCTPPPAPPTPVATLAPTLAPAQQIVAVHLSPTRVRRGHTTKLVVTAAADDGVTVVVQYRQGKPVTYHGKVGSSGTYVKSWKVPTSVATGKAQAKVTVESRPTPYSTTISFTVTK